MKDTLKKIVLFVSHPLAMLLVLVACMLFSRDFMLLPPAIYVNALKSVAITLCAMPALIYLISKLLQKRNTSYSGNLLVLAAFAVYFTMLTFMASTAFKPLSLMQQLPLAILIAALILENHKLLQMRQLCLTSLTATLFFASLLFKTNYIAPITAAILVAGGVMFFALEESNGNYKPLFINTLSGLAITIIYFFITTR